MEKFIHSNIKKWIFSPLVTDKERFEIKNAIYNCDLKKNRSHYFNGRWENIYISHDLIPNLEKILFFAGQIGKNIYGKTVVVPRKDMGCHSNEYWFNISKPGQSTRWHDHKKEAKLSGVYYIDVPNNSGNILFRTGESNKKSDWEIKSQTGQMILFPAIQKHSVDINRSSRNRISLGFNLYTLPIKEIDQGDGYAFSKYYG
tara:strand:- start:199 stop:801 length:603 start_codon:yes stop_codon:yes gene_type:complete